VGEQYFPNLAMGSRGCSVLDLSLQPLIGLAEARPGLEHDGTLGGCSEHAIPDRKSVVLLGAALFAFTGQGDAIGEMPWPEFVGVTGVGR
jgi:hypothetical protein